MDIEVGGHEHVDEGLYSRQIAVFGRETQKRMQKSDVLIVGLGIVLWSMWVIVLQWSPLRNAYEGAAAWIDVAFGLILLGLAVRLMIGG